MSYIYCIRCKEHTENKNRKISRTYNGRITFLAKCGVCNIKKKILGSKKSDVSRGIYMPIHQYECLNYGAQKRKYTFFYTDFFKRLCFFNLPLKKFVFKLKKTYLSYFKPF